MSIGTRGAWVTALAGLALVAGASAGIAAEPHPAGSASLLGKQLVGTWRVVAIEDRKDAKDPGSEWVYPYGRNPKGYIVYDGTGHVSVQIMRTPPPVAPRAGGTPPTAEELLALHEGYAAYFGTYTVDEANGTVTHHVEGSSLPEYLGTDQVRPFTLSGDRLEIGDRRTWRRVLERVK